jgi:hypothetical protein
MEARTEIEFARRFGAGSLPNLPLRGEEDRDRRPDLLREDRRGTLVEGVAEGVSSESLRAGAEHVYHR